MVGITGGVGSVEGLHGKKINLLAPGEHSSIHSRVAANNASSGDYNSSQQQDQTQHPAQASGAAAAPGKSYSLQVPHPMKITDQVLFRQHQQHLLMMQQ